jgi:excisionase family DNA binding protein
MAVETKELYVASELADLCKVDLKTIHNWVDKGHLAAFRTPGRHLRFKAADVLAFMTKFGYPVPAALTADVAATDAPKGETVLSEEQRAAVAAWLALPGLTRRSAMIELAEFAEMVGVD